ncbi:unnamed protein product [Allacma fusca]|uniref:Uncharacterized protein n=1 Tax=Allacma fusca TaxID=39272 RepID=A0A8J2KKC0_9HEXA|nr:unnamed protein product [Allacma fusca]
MVGVPKGPMYWRFSLPGRDWREESLAETFIMLKGPRRHSQLQQISVKPIPVVCFAFFLGTRRLLRPVETLGWKCRTFGSSERWKALVPATATASAGFICLVVRLAMAPMPRGIVCLDVEATTAADDKDDTFRERWDRVDLAPTRESPTGRVGGGGGGIIPRGGGGFWCSLGGL